MIEAYVAGTGNGERAAIALGESGLPWKATRFRLEEGRQKQPGFLALNPIGAIPVIVDPEGPGGARVVLSQSGAIVLYLAEKTGKFLPKDPQRRAAAYQWFMLASTDAAPASAAIFMLAKAVPEKSTANVGFFEQRLLDLLRAVDRQLAGNDYIVGEFSIADIALYPIVYNRRDVVDRAGGLGNLTRWAALTAARPGVRQGMEACV